MLGKQSVWLAGAGGAAVAGVAILWLLSPWFLWQLLPAADFKAVVTSDRRVAGLVPAFKRVEPLLGAARQIGVATSPDGETIFIIRPTVRGYFSLRHELRQNGYVTIWYGPWLVAGPAERLAHATLWSALRASWQQRWVAYNPLFIAEGKGWGLDQPIRAVGMAVGHEWRVVVSPAGETAQTLETLAVQPPQAVGESAATVSLPGAIVGELPEGVKKSWNRQLQQQYGFTKTKPDFMRELGQYQTVHMVMTAEGVGLAAVGNTPQWRGTVEQWLGEEERHGRIEKRSFRLPDGSRGAEYVPGPRRAVLTARGSDPACAEGQIQERHFWLCGEHDSWFTSTERLLATPVPSLFAVTVGKNFLPAAGDEKLQAATAVSSREHTLIRLLWESKR